MPRPASSSQRLYDVASGQGGYFTSRQALDAGYGDNLHPYHVRAGNWVRERRGVYRLTQFPQPSRPDLMVLQLWSRNRQDEPQGVFSHTTALTLHDLSDAMPAKVDMTCRRDSAAWRPSQACYAFTEGGCPSKTQKPLRASASPRHCAPSLT